MNLRYGIITPVRDEEENLSRMIESVLKQSVLPEDFLIIDDGSTDRTPQIIDSYLAKNTWIRKITLTDRGHRLQGGEQAVHLAFREVRWDKIDILARMDADVSFGGTYFETLLRKFEEEPLLGIASGVIYEFSRHEWRKQHTPIFHTRGASKLYRKQCFKQIEPIGHRLGWDGQDEARANCYGWITRRYDDAKLYHHRPVGSSMGKLFFNRNLGLSAYYIGYHPLFQIVRVISRLYRWPYFLGSLMMFIGWIEGYLRRMDREDRIEVVKFVRKQQINRLIGKETMWK
jgi:biofilm PGA synthesis N-glycosyltransferase PgaC